MAGDVFRILTSVGVCYGLITHLHKDYGGVIAVFREFYYRPPKGFQDVVEKKPRFITTFPIGAAVKQGLFALLVEVKVPEHLAQFPTFKRTADSSQKGSTWVFWNGEKEWTVTRPLTPTEKLYPIGPQVLTAPQLVKMIKQSDIKKSDYIRNIKYY